MSFTRFFGVLSPRFERKKKKKEEKKKRTPSRESLVRINRPVNLIVAPKRPESSGGNETEEKKKRTKRNASMAC